MHLYFAMTLKFVLSKPQESDITEKWRGLHYRPENFFGTLCESCFGPFKVIKFKRLFQQFSVKLA